MQLATLEAALAELEGGTFVGIDTVTAVKLKGGKKNPLQGRVTKRTMGATVMCFSNKNGSAYDAMVKRRLAKEGKNPDSFTLGERAWGQRIPGTAFVEHKGKHYLEVIFMQAGKTELLLDGQPVSSQLIDGLPETREGGQAGLDDKVIIRTYAVDSITAIRANGKDWM